jgi:hypothetical protein
VTDGAVLQIDQQHLRIKAFYGASANAVKTQAWTAISVYVLVAIVKSGWGCSNASTQFSRSCV